MKDRVISCIAFVIIVAAFILLREFVDYRLFDILICFIAICGSAEICNESKKIVGKAVAVVSIIFGVLLVPSLLKHLQVTGTILGRQQRKVTM